MTQHWSHSYKKLPQQPWWHRGFLGHKKDPSICSKALTEFLWLRQKVKQEVISMPSSMPRGAILNRSRPWWGIVRGLRNVNTENRRSTGSWCLTPLPLPQHSDSHYVTFFDRCQTFQMMSDISWIEVSQVFYPKGRSTWSKPPFPHMGRYALVKTVQ